MSTVERIAPDEVEVIDQTFNVIADYNSIAPDKQKGKTLRDLGIVEAAEVAGYSVLIAEHFGVRIPMYDQMKGIGRSDAFLQWTVEELGRFTHKKVQALLMQ
ncbi:hypothetical protein K8942_02655 [Candidatus Peribacteria bacterium]|nr:MAG: hypothetical protein K8942_02655 [Candidatus Peribacteria bacterium]